MTKATTDKTPSRPRRLAWLWPSSLILHLAILLVLAWTGVLTFELSFDRQESQKDSQKRSERGRAHRDRLKQERDARRLTEKHKNQRKREIERKPTLAMKHYVERLAETRDRMQAVKTQRLRKIEQRSLEEYRLAMITQIEHQARIVQRFAKNHLHWHKDKPHQQAVDEATEAIALAEKLRRAPNDEKLAQQMDTLARSLVDHSRQALRKELKLKSDADVDGRTLPRTSKQLAQIATKLHNPPEMKTFNNTSAAKWEGDQDLDSSRLAKLDATSVNELYQLAQGLAKETATHYQDAQAAKFASDRNLSFNAAKKALAVKEPLQLADLSTQLTLPDVTSVGDIGQYRKTLEQAVQQTKSALGRSTLLLAQARGLDSGSRSAFVASAMSGQGSGGGGGGGGEAGLLDHVQQAGGAQMPPSQRRSSVRVDSQQVLAQALPGRRFSKDSTRQGWLYVNTWYIIGPWENHGSIEYNQTHPPEYEVDFDAEYLDGKVGVFPTSTKQRITVDGVLRWRFTQSDCIRILPHVQSPDSTFYAYTELYFDEATDMVFGIPSDDCTRVWINKEMVWEEFGQSGWGLSESFCRVRFEQGTNTVLIRLENGPHETQFSFFVCPSEAIRRVQQ